MLFRLWSISHIMTRYKTAVYTHAVVSTPTYANTFITAKFINIMKTFKTNNMEIVRHARSSPGSDCAATWLFRAQRINWNLANSYTIVIFIWTLPLTMPRPHKAETVSDDARLTSVWRLSVAYVGPKSRTEWPRKTKIGTEVAHVTRDSDTTFKVKRSKVNLQRVGHIVAASHRVCCFYLLYVANILMVK